MNEGALIQRVYIKKPIVGDPVEIYHGPVTGAFLVYDVGEVRRDITGREYYEILLKRPSNTIPPAFAADLEQRDNPQ